MDGIPGRLEFPHPQFHVSAIVNCYDAMTSLLKLCRTEDQSRVAIKLGGHGVETDKDLLLADEAVLQKCGVSKMVPEGPKFVDNSGA